jgi:hypothetical protein
VGKIYLAGINVSLSEGDCHSAKGDNRKTIKGTEKLLK